MADSKNMPPTLVPIRLGPTQVRLKPGSISGTPVGGSTGNMAPRRGKPPLPKKGIVGPIPPKGLSPSGGGGGLAPPLLESSSQVGAGSTTPMNGSPAHHGHGGAGNVGTGLGLPPPPTLTDPSELPGSQTRGTALVTIVSVDNPTTPKYATVAVNNKFPFESGYLIPAGVGPFVEGPPGVSTTSNTAVVGPVPHSKTISPNSMHGFAVGISVLVDSTGPNPETVTITAVDTVNNKVTAVFTHIHAVNFPMVSAKPTQKGQVGFYYYNNPTTQTGGSICTADLDRRVILSFSGDFSTTAPTPYYKAIADHRHDGNLNTPDGFDNADPLNLPGGEVTGNLPYANNSQQVYNMIDPYGNWLAVEFPGVTIDNTGAMTMVNRVTSVQSYPIVDGQLIELEVQLGRNP